MQEGPFIFSQLVLINKLLINNSDKVNKTLAYHQEKLLNALCTLALTLAVSL